MLELSTDRTNINPTTTLALLFSMMTKIEERKVVRRRVMVVVVVGGRVSRVGVLWEVGGRHLIGSFLEGTSPHKQVEHFKAKIA